MTVLPGTLLLARLHTVQSSVGVVCNTRICHLIHQGAALGGPVVLRPVRATLSFITVPCYLLSWTLRFFVCHC